MLTALGVSDNPSVIRSDFEISDLGGVLHEDVRENGVRRLDPELAGR